MRKLREYWPRWTDFAGDVIAVLSIFGATYAALVIGHAVIP